MHMLGSNLDWGLHPPERSSVFFVFSCSFVHSFMHSHVLIISFLWVHPLSLSCLERVWGGGLDLLLSGHWVGHLIFLLVFLFYIMMVGSCWRPRFGLGSNQSGMTLNTSWALVGSSQPDCLAGVLLRAQGQPQLVLKCGFALLCSLCTPFLRGPEGTVADLWQDLEFSVSWPIPSWCHIPLAPTLCVPAPSTSMWVLDRLC